MTEKVSLHQLVSTLLDPVRHAEHSPRTWNGVLLAAREHGLLARLSRALSDAGVTDSLPSKAQAHLLAARIASESTHTAVRFEVNRILRALAGQEIPVILLKGTAYAFAGLPAARGRMIGDVDLMVPRQAIGEVERALVAGGWEPSELNDYDQRYYREWMHEIPPLQHPERDTPVDIHHTITPATGRYPVDAAALFAASLALADRRLRILAPADMVLHCAAHLFNTEVGNPLRDLFDLRDLLTDFSTAPRFWDALLARAGELSLERPLYYALRTARRLIQAPVPPEVEQSLARAGPAGVHRALMDGLFTALIMPAPKGAFRLSDELARVMLFARAHWLSMPPLRLARHLAIKAGRGIAEKFTHDRQDAPA